MEHLFLFAAVFTFVLIGDWLAYKFYPTEKEKNLKSHAITVVLVQFSIISFIYIVVS
ncbi:hypothetical protein U0355_09255 [Salimicrobium sp. PL1-032A]|uniref:hypothetical protein n=1 Tax=Salimicrobium sp. PL1-032A TaxID=3095364 RepID=UPI0032606CE8